MSLPASRYELTADVQVQTSCQAGGYATFTKATARYELVVASDPTWCVHDAMLADIRDAWLGESDSYLRAHEYLPAEKHVFSEKGRYVLYVQHRAADISYDDLWLAGRAVRARFLGFRRGGGWGGQQNFMQEIVKYRVAGKTIKSDYKSHFPPNRFLDLYAQGAFRKPNELATTSCATGT